MVQSLSLSSAPALPATKVAGQRRVTVARAASTYIKDDTASLSMGKNLTKVRR